MSRTQADRIDDALSQLVERLLPQIVGEDDAEGDERYFAALEVARETIDQCVFAITSKRATSLYQSQAWP